MKLKISSVLLVFVGILFCAFRVYGKTDSLTKADKGHFYVKVGGGIATARWLNGEEGGSDISLKSLNSTVCGSIQYFVGKDIALCLTMGYTEGTTDHNVIISRGELVDSMGFGVNVNSKMHDYSRRSYYVFNTAAECVIVIDRIYKSSRVVYCSASLGLSHVHVNDHSGYYTEYPNSTFPASTGFRSFTAANSNKFTSHITLAGIRGGKTVCWYAELGYGFKGILNAGLAVKL